MGRRGYTVLGVVSLVILCGVAFVAFGHGNDSGSPSATPEPPPSEKIPGEGTAFKLSGQGLTIKPPLNEYVVNRSLTEVLRSFYLAEYHETVTPACRKIQNPVTPSSWECLVPLAANQAIRRWIDFVVDPETGAVRELASGTLNPNNPNPIPPENYEP